MKLEATEVREVSPEQLARAIAHSSPEEFAAMWLEFNSICEREKVNLFPFAEAMAPELGSNRKKPLRTIFDYIQYIEIKDSKELTERATGSC